MLFEMKKKEDDTKINIFESTLGSGDLEGALTKKSTVCTLSEMDNPLNSAVHAFNQRSRMKAPVQVSLLYSPKIGLRYRSHYSFTNND